MTTPVVLTNGGAMCSFTTQNTIWPVLKTAVVIVSNKDGSSTPLASPMNSKLRSDAERLVEQAKQILSGLRGGFTDHGYRIVCAGTSLQLVARADASGKLEQYQISE
jgi:hypothetical protein